MSEQRYIGAEPVYAVKFNVELVTEFANDAEWIRGTVLGVTQTLKDMSDRYRLVCDLLEVKKVRVG